MNFLRFDHHHSLFGIRRGFSLIELLFAMLFMTVIIFGVMKLQISNITLTNTQKLEMKAHFYATQGLTIVQTLGYVNLSSCTSPCYLDKNSDYSLLSNGSETLESGLFQREVSHDETGLADASLVTVTVKWADSSGDHNVSAKRVVF